MPDQHKLTREEHRVAVVKFTQELTDHPAGQCWQRLRVKLILIERRVYGKRSQAETSCPTTNRAASAHQRTAALIGVVSQRSCAATGFTRSAAVQAQKQRGDARCHSDSQ